MTIEDVYRSIDTEISLFEDFQGKSPEKIFISYPLLDLISLHSNIRIYKSERRGILLFQGIPVQPYKCEEMEFYLAERKGEFRKECEGCK